MARPLRIQFPGAVYHVTLRGDRPEPISMDDVDRRALLHVLGAGLDRFDAFVLAWCLMGNHDHFVLQTRQANLSNLVRHVNGVFMQRFNQRHATLGHLFQGSFEAVLVDRVSYLLEARRHLELNPLRAGMVDQAGAGFVGVASEPDLARVATQVCTPYTDAISHSETTMSITTVFTNNRSQAVRLPADVRLPDGVKKVQVRARGMDRIISPVGHTWDAFFMNGPQASDDFLAERATQVQSEREAL